MFRQSADPSRLFISGWNPNHVNGSSARGWGKTSDNHVPQEPGACWDQNGDTAPMGLQELSIEEKEVSQPGMWRNVADFLGLFNRNQFTAEASDAEQGTAEYQRPKRFPLARCWQRVRSDLTDHHQTWRPSTRNDRLESLQCRPHLADSRTFPGRAFVLVSAQGQRAQGE